MELSEIVHELRIKSGLTLEELGNKVGVGKSTVRKWETGQIANMRRDKIDKLAKALGVTPGYLMGWDKPSVSNLQLTSFEIELIKNYRSADAGTQAAVDKLLDLPDSVLKSEAG